MNRQSYVKKSGFPGDLINLLMFRKLYRESKTIEYTQALLQLARAKTQIKEANVLIETLMEILAEEVRGVSAIRSFPIYYNYKNKWK